MRRGEGSRGEWEWMKQLYTRGRESEAGSETKEEAKELMDVYDVTRALDVMIGQTKAERRLADQNAAVAAAAAAAATGWDEEEEDVDSLVDWAINLCDDYESTWRQTGATRPAKRDKTAAT